MGYVWETENLVKEFTLSSGLFKPKQTVHALQGGLACINRKGGKHSVLLGNPVAVNPLSDTP
nr:hypothetical protein [Veillonella denticariosi]